MGPFATAVVSAETLRMGDSWDVMFWRGSLCDWDGRRAGPVRDSLAARHPEKRDELVARCAVESAGSAREAVRRAVFAQRYAPPDCRIS